jgi:hypothetical protein
VVARLVNLRAHRSTMAMRATYSGDRPIWANCASIRRRASSAAAGSAVALPEMLRHSGDHRLGQRVQLPGWPRGRGGVWISGLHGTTSTPRFAAVGK